MSKLFKFSQTSELRLKQVHPDLQALANRALEITVIDFGIAEGLRTMEQQKKYVQDGKSTTLKSRHLTGHAIDVYAWLGGKVCYEKEPYKFINEAFGVASKDLGIPYQWGGNWINFKDYVHFQLPFITYPAWNKHN